jgi:hypothetical protein
LFNALSKVDERDRQDASKVAGRTNEPKVLAAPDVIRRSLV